MRRLVFVAGPFSAPSPEEAARNVERARLLGVLAVRRGLAPIVPHLQGAAGLYGTEHDDGAGSATRTMALACSTVTACMVGEYCGHLWVILRDDRLLSAGCQAELEAWTEGQASERGRAGPLVWRREGYLGGQKLLTWAEWLPEFDAASVAVPEELRSLDSLGGKR